MGGSYARDDLQPENENEGERVEVPELGRAQAADRVAQRRRLVHGDTHRVKPVQQQGERRGGRVTTNADEYVKASSVLTEAKLSPAIAAETLHASERGEHESPWAHVPNTRVVEWRNLFDHLRYHSTPRWCIAAVGVRTAAWDVVRGKHEPL
jgi:hypothetical protein